MLERVQTEPMSIADKINLLSQARRLFELSGKPELISQVEKLQQNVQECGGAVSTQIPRLSILGWLQALWGSLYSAFWSLLEIMALGGNADENLQ